jgi:Fur family ferric uptake transcriptional regulator
MSPGESVLDELRRSGFRITPQREMIVVAMAESDGHVTADEVFAGVQARTSAINLATVYRTLDLLVDEGLASRVDLGEGHVVYATANHPAHLHLVCRKCGRIIEADPELLEPVSTTVALRHQFQPDVRHISIFGTCSDCAIGGQV